MTTADREYIRQVFVIASEIETEDSTMRHDINREGIEGIAARAALDAIIDDQLDHNALIGMRAYRIVGLSPETTAQIISTMAALINKDKR